MKLIKKSLFLFIFLITFTGCKQEKNTYKYVASTSWVASIAQMAGIDDVYTIAPVNLKHPPEYEITPNDILKVSEAELIMHAGYERMISVMSSAAEIDKNKMIKVKTTNTEENLVNMVKMLSERAGTREEGERRMAEYQRYLGEVRERIRDKGIDKLRVYANINQAEFARDLGLQVVETFGGGPLTANQIALAADEKYDLIIDNLHNPVADPIKQVSPESKILVWKNFPDKYEKDALLNVLKANCESLFEF